MANPRKRLPANVPGDFFVDATCIDCDACRQLAPEVFAERGDYSAVVHQPENATERRQAFRALLACPTGSIGTEGRNEAAHVRPDFPLPIEDEVFYCGFNSPKSYGGNAYFIQHAAGNWLIDSPKFLPYLVSEFEKRGGIRYIFLTHEDDVADADRYAQQFGSSRIIHRLELGAQPNAEVVLDGGQAVAFQPDFLIIPTPGHTAGHCVLLYRNRFLFTGDHLSWDRDEQCLHASRDYCWHSWTEQTESMARLREYSFEWVLPGHGQRAQRPAAVMHRELAALVERMRRSR
jgi:glyoxylase-like metal-dependent hydrolase (beta-lactamase superfamily II)/ferredoxin